MAGLDDNEVPPDIAETINSALTQIYADAEDTMVNRWVLSVELIRSDGVRGNMYIASPEMRLWEIIGMNETASQYARTRLAMEYAEDLDLAEEDIEDVEE